MLELIYLQIGSCLNISRNVQRLYNLRLCLQRWHQARVQMNNIIAFEWAWLEELLMVSESRVALTFSGNGTHFVATPAIFLESVQTETL